MKYVLLIFTDSLHLDPRHILKIDDFSIVYTVPQFIIMYIIRLTSGLKHIKL